MSYKLYPIGIKFVIRRERNSTLMWEIVDYDNIHREDYIYVVKSNEETTDPTKKGAKCTAAHSLIDDYYEIIYTPEVTKQNRIELNI